MLLYFVTADRKPDRFGQCEEVLKEQRDMQKCRVFSLYHEQKSDRETLWEQQKRRRTVSYTLISTPIINIVPFVPAPTGANPEMKVPHESVYGPAPIGAVTGCFSSAGASG